MTPVFRHGGLRLYLLKLLDEQPRHGYDVIRLLEDRFMGLYAPSAGTVYPRLARLEEEGLVDHVEEDGRKVYRITDRGRAELAARLDELSDIEADIVGSVKDLAAEIRSEVKGSVSDLRAELKNAARDIRRETRHDARTSLREGGAARVEMENLATWVRAELRQATRRANPTTEQVAACRIALQMAMNEVRRVLNASG